MILRVSYPHSLMGCHHMAETEIGAFQPNSYWFTRVNYQKACNLRFLRPVTPVLGKAGSAHRWPPRCALGDRVDGTPGPLLYENLYFSNYSSIFLSPYGSICFDDFVESPRQAGLWQGLSMAYRKE